MHLIFDVDTYVPQDGSTLLLLGHACYADLKSAGEPLLVDAEYIRQPSLQLRKTKQTLTCYVAQPIFERIGSRRDVLLAPYLLYSMFKAKTTRNQLSLFFCLVREARGQYTEIFGFNGQDLVIHATKIDFDISMLSQYRQQDFRDASVHIYTHEVNVTHYSWPDYVTVHSASPFSEQKGLTGAIESIFKPKSHRLLDASNSLLHGDFKQTLLPAAVAVAALCSIPILTLIKQSEFNSVQRAYHEIASVQDALPEQSELRLWESRSRFVRAMDTAESTTTKVTELLQALSRASRLTGPVAFDRLDIKGSSPFELNGKSYNIAVEVGLLVEPDMTAEEQAAKFAVSLTETLGKNITGSVDVWDDVITRKMQGKDYYFARFYLLATTEVVDATTN